MMKPYVRVCSAKTIQRHSMMMSQRKASHLFLPTKYMPMMPMHASIHDHWSGVILFYTKCLTMDAVARIAHATLNRMMVGSVLTVDDQMSAMLDMTAKM